MRSVWRNWRKGNRGSADEITIPRRDRAGERSRRVDFGYVGRLYDAASGMLSKAWVFVLVLAVSRQMVAQIVFDQKINM